MMFLEEFVEIIEYSLNLYFATTNLCETYIGFCLQINFPYVNTQTFMIFIKQSVHLRNFSQLSEIFIMISFLF